MSKKYKCASQLSDRRTAPRVILNEIDQGGNSEKDGDDDRRGEQPFFQAAAGVESRAEIVAAAEGATDLGARALEQDYGNQNNGQNDLDIGKENLHREYTSTGSKAVQESRQAHSFQGDIA